MKKPKLVISHMRSDSQGIKGTYRDIDKDFPNLLRYFNMIVIAITELGFAEWKQGHKVHELITIDNRRFTLRFYKKYERYCGIRLSLRLERSLEVRLMDAETTGQIIRMIAMLNELVRPARGDKTSLLTNEQYLQA